MCNLELGAINIYLVTVHIYISYHSCWHPLLEALSLLFNMGDVLNHIKGCVTTLYTEKCSCFIVKD